VERYLGGQLKGAAPCKESEEHGHGHIESWKVPAQGEYEKDELGRLREEAELLRQQLEEAERKLNRIG
jgi:hypothetical protein